MSAPNKSPLIVIAGATASGKSALAVAIARREDGVIVNADAMQVYGDLRLLTARPTAAEEAAVPHRLYGVRDAADACSAADWAALAKAEIAAIDVAGRVPIIVGGTGLYLSTLLSGIAPVPAIDPEVRAEVRALDGPAAWERLQALDPAGAARLRAGDRQRVARALEVAMSTGRPLGAWQQAREGGIAPAFAVRAVVVEVPPSVLAARIEARLAAMLAGGALDEVAALVARALDPALPILKAVGLLPFAAHLAGELALAAAAELAAAQTRQYAKRQRTWFRNQCAGWERVEPGNFDSLLHRT